MFSELFNSNIIRLEIQQLRQSPELFHRGTLVDGILQSCQSPNHIDREASCLNIQNLCQPPELFHWGTLVDGILQSCQSPYLFGREAVSLDMRQLLQSSELFDWHTVYLCRLLSSSTGAPS